MLVLIAGVSGSGKDTIKREILDRMEKVITIPSYTTREMRDGDIPGVTYNFVSDEEFRKMIDNNEFYEYDFHHDKYYGTSKKILNTAVNQGYTVIKDIDVNGVENLVQILKNDIKVVTIFLRVPIDVLKERLINRNPNISQEELSLRLGRLEYEESKIPNFKYVIDNIDLEETLQKIQDIINNENSR